MLQGTVIRRERMTERPWMARACPMQHDPMPSRTHSRPKYLLREKKCFSGRKTVANTINGFDQVGIGSGFSQFATQVLDVSVHGSVTDDTVVGIN